MESPDLPAPRSALESEFEQFLRESQREARREGRGEAQGDGTTGSPGQTAGEASSADPRSLRAWLELAEAWKITKTLRECRGNRSAAARALGIGRRTLYAKMEKLQIAPTWAMRGHSIEK